MPIRVVNVPLDKRSYSILIGENLLSDIGAKCRRLELGQRCAIISDRNVAPLYAQRVRDSLEANGFDACQLVISAGEKSKSLSVVETCYDQLAAHRLERKSFIVALGGGVVGDIAGFVAATYLRGIPFVQIPTTLLAQVDSSVGGKVGVNLKAGKNLVGAFHQPRLVLCDLDVLGTLPPREFRAGLAEVIKYGIIYDAALFQQIERDLEKALAFDSKTLSSIISRCCEIKAEVVGQDETETGMRAILNFGHTLGHALEAISHYGKYFHGEAISIGQVAAARLSTALLNFPASAADRIEQLFARAGLPTSVNLSASKMAALCDAMRLDKKVSGGEVKFVLAKRLGEVVWGQKVPLALIEQVLEKSRGASVESREPSVERPEQAARVQARRTRQPSRNTQHATREVRQLRRTAN